MAHAPQSQAVDDSRDIPEQRIIRVLAHAPADQIAEKLNAYSKTDRSGIPKWHFIRKPEAGLVMVRGRMGGSGGAFNFGEVTVTRAAVALSDGVTGFSYALGRDQKKAEQAAIIHALWKTAAHTQRVEADIIGPLEALNMAREQAVREEVAPTKVDFYTLVRGDD
ncbi:MAG: phosphonate C-P lyase system protein PhnG [Pseudomonadota bacterium]